MISRTELEQLDLSTCRIVGPGVLELGSGYTEVHPPLAHRELSVQGAD